MVNSITCIVRKGLMACYIDVMFEIEKPIKTDCYIHCQTKELQNTTIHLQNGRGQRTEVSNVLGH